MLLTPISKSILHTTDNYIKALNKGGIFTVFDMLNYFPKDFEDRTNVLDAFLDINIKEKNTILLKLISISNTKTSNNKILTKAIFEDKNGFLAEGVWFNRNYFSSQLQKYCGKQVIVAGKVKYEYGKLSFISPEVDGDLSKIGGEIVPIYPDLNYIPGKWIEQKMHLLEKYIDYIVETLPEEIIKKYNFIPKKEAYRKLHFPKTKKDIEIARFRLGYEELYQINFDSIKRKYENISYTEGKSISIPLNPELVKEIIKKISFDLTNAQKISLFQILKDMEKTHSMQRLLEGDVGTGKTIVAVIAAIHAIKQTKNLDNPIQVAIMAPTEILARQHFEGLQEIFMNFQISSHLLVGSMTAKQKAAIKAHIKSGNIDVVIGTHALLEESVVFKNLGFVVIDEQHRFGVKQREILEKGLGNLSCISPHSLNMTATPIPRTLALTIYGDQDLSILNEYPKDRKVIYTKVVRSKEERRQVELFIRGELEKGRQVFWISPLVEESEKLDLANAVSTFQSLVDIFSPFSVGLLHGKMKPKEKEAIMRDFVENKIQILSSTSVVEVGVNVPNATIICIEGAERFGLSQLHQFRGRVGRGKYQSYCYLFPTSGQKTDRLSAIEKTNNGFELSEIDLELRGPGEVYGVKQSGMPDLKIASITDLALISDIREDIEEMFRKKII